MSLKDEYCELIALTKLYLLQEHQPSDWKYCDEESFNYFKETAKKGKPKEAPPPPPPPPPVKPVQQTAPPPKAPEVVIAAPVVSKPVVAAEPVKQVETATDFSDIKRIMQTRFPTLALLPTPPDDREAKSLMEKKITTAEVVILSFDKQTPLFLKNLAIAIQQELATSVVLSAQRIESDKGWEKLLRENQPKLIISTDYGLYTLQDAMQYYREIPKQAKYFLGNTPLLLLTDLSLYLKEPKLKPTLWRAICQMLK